jgi:hypothetical protein
MHVNKQELARLLGISLPTVAAYIARYGSDFPVIERGTNGRDWQFEHEDVVAFLARKRAEDREADAERAATLRQFMLPLGHNVGPPIEQSCATPAALLALARLRKLQREEAYENGRLVVAAEIERLLEDMLIDWNRMLHATVRQFGRENSLTNELQERLEVALCACQHKFVDFFDTKLRPKSERDLFDHAA